LSLKLRQRGKNPEDEFAGCRRGVEPRAVPGQDLEADPLRGKVVHGIDQMPQIAAKRSSFQTTSTSPAWSALRQAARPGRSSRQPEAKSSYRCWGCTPAASSALR